MSGQRGMSTLGAVLLAGTAGLLTATLMMDWMVVDVHVVEEDTPIHIKVPVPLVLADIAAGFIPDELLEDAEIPPEVKAQKELVLATVASLLDSPDTHLVKVRTEDANVDVFKEADPDLFDAEERNPGCRKLDRERQAVPMGTDSLDVSDR